jgi:uncharacterized membrane protein
MAYLIVAIVVWSLIHFIPATALTFRTGLVRRLGVTAYKGLFAVVAFAALLLIISNWKSASVSPVYAPPSWGPYLTIVFTLAAFILFFAPYFRSSLSRYIRHPQLLGVVVWGLGHLLSNGEARSIVLFGGFAVWAVLQIALLNRRDGAWTRPQAASVISNIRLLLAGLGFFILALYFHGRLFGVDPLAYLHA